MNGNTARMAQRYAAYAALRDEGTEPWPAAAQVGVSTATGERYETAWRKAHPDRAARRKPYRDTLDQAQGRKAACARWHESGCNCWQAEASA